MKFMVSLITDGTAMEGLTQEEMGAFGRRMSEFMYEIRSAGVLVSTGRLGPATDARTIRPGDGAPSITDGPFAETKEQIAGYMVLDCESIDGAVEWVESMPVLGGALEIRPITDYEEAT